VYQFELIHYPIFPDVNVWLALVHPDHVHRASAEKWWESDLTAVIGFFRSTQIGVLRLLTTAAVMNGKPLRMPEAWAAYDRLFVDERVAFFDEPRGIDDAFANMRARITLLPSFGQTPGCGHSPNAPMVWSLRSTGP
jgi:predicted nucleic acid-binding protein